MEGRLEKCWWGMKFALPADDSVGHTIPAISIGQGLERLEGSTPLNMSFCRQQHTVTRSPV